MGKRWQVRPAGSNWGDFGPDDQLGRVNLIDRHKVLQGIAEVFNATAKKLKEANVSFDYITPEKAKVEAKNYTAQLGPKVDTGAMTVGKK